eukprot:13815477-Alexandrium_andersonii.AAC.1
MSPQTMSMPGCARVGGILGLAKGFSEELWPGNVLLGFLVLQVEGHDHDVLNAQYGVRQVDLRQVPLDLAGVRCRWKW